MCDATLGRRANAARNDRWFWFLRSQSQSAKGWDPFFDLTFLTYQRLQQASSWQLRLRHGHGSANASRMGEDLKILNLTLSVRLPASMCQDSLEPHGPGLRWLSSSSLHHKEAPSCVFSAIQSLTLSFDIHTPPPTPPKHGVLRMLLIELPIVFVQ